MTLKLIVSIPTFCLVAALREMRAASAAEETVSLTTISMPILYTGDAHSDTSDHTDKLILSLPDKDDLQTELLGECAI